MALFGSLGKLLGLDSPTGRGFITGFAETGTKLLQEDMKNEQEKIDRIAEYKIKKDQEDQDRYEKELRENTEALRNIVGQVGNITGAEYLVRQYGIKGAIKKADTIEAVAGFTGQTPDFFTKDENITKLEDLASFVTSAPKVSKVAPISSSGGLLSGLGLGRDLTGEVQAQVDEAASNLGIGTIAAPDLGDMPATNLDLVSLGAMADADDEMKRLLRLSLNAKDPEVAKEYRRKAEEMRLFIQSTTTKGNLTEPQGRAAGKLFGNRIGNAAGFESVMDGAGGFITKYEEASNKTKADLAESVLADIYSRAIAAGMNSTQANVKITQAIGQNILPKLVVKDGIVAIITEGQGQLVQGGFIGGKNAYAQNPVDPSDTSAKVDTDNAVATPELQTLIAQYNSATHLNQKKFIRSKIGRLYGADAVAGLN